MAVCTEGSLNHMLAGGVCTDDGAGHRTSWFVDTDLTAGSGDGWVWVAGGRVGEQGAGVAFLAAPDLLL